MIRPLLSAFAAVGLALVIGACSANAQTPPQPPGSQPRPSRPPSDSAPSSPSTQTPPSPSTQTPQAAAQPSAAYVVGPRDVLQITVFEEADLSKSYTVENDGTISFPYVGRVEVGGLTLRAIEERLTKRLADGYLRRPQVTVTVEQYHSQNIYVTGEVRMPGRYSLAGNMTVMDALAQAGSPTAEAAGEVQIIHPKTTRATGPLRPEDAPDAEIHRIPLSDVLALQAAAIRDGDTIYVPRAETFYITGEVRNPGTFVLEPKMTVLEALSRAGGKTDRAGRAIRIQRIVDGEVKEVDAELTDLIQAGDTVKVTRRFF